VILGVKEFSDYNSSDSPPGSGSDSESIRSAMLVEARFFNIFEFPPGPARSRSLLLTEAAAPWLSDWRRLFPAV